MYGKAVNLRGGDVPGMGTLVAGFETHNGPPFDSCATHVGASGEVVGIESPWFVRSRGQRHLRAGVIVGRPPVEGVHSVVYVMRGPDLASRSVAALRRSGAPGCVELLSAKPASRRLVGREPYKLDIRASSLPFPLAAVAGYGVRVSGTLAAALYHQSKRSAFYEDTFGFAVGPAEIVLHADGAARPVPSAVEGRLLSVLYDRAKAHALS
jgi:hypothetical protein